MVGVAEPEETMSQGEVEPSLLLQSNDQLQKSNTQHPFSTLGRQSSIYSLTLDEFQHTLCESGKNFGSMNMDEFLTSIWTAEENQANNTNTTTQHHTNNSDNNNHSSSYNNGHGGGAAAAAELLSLSEVTADEVGLASQPSLTRQGSLTLPSPLCRKTVEEVWSEIHNKGRHQDDQQKQRKSTSATTRTPNPHISVGDGARNSEFTPRQPTFGEMTLEDFLVKAGVVREPAPLTTVAPTPTQSQKSQQYGMYRNNSSGAGPSFVNRVAGTSNATVGGGGGGISAYPSTVAFGDSSVFAGNGSRNGAYTQPPPPPGVCYGGRGGNGGGGYAGAAQAPMGLAAPMSPVSSDGMCGSQVENSGNQFGLDMGGLRGRKRILDGPVEKVVERRQRRMIKNRESAARSRARKQAYTVELEAELNQLREENAHLKQALEELERKQKQQYFDEMKLKVQTRVSIAKETLRVFRRHLSCPL
ncbi:protein ABSCISIC ACID-INSENSITIVE 5 [Humulus lupulus]|uniref:protein ABSCISIC ACID-INSENSITIVE 5 n=1 Tax=Humulus lupulus TaxID=3486 RepID=UPI002B400A8A|nr:protein ABSCISIC ACID-INSENSITIVE 5 [Humulus lupulus]XP_062117584.1 protein ABSCISIC ACID-INSENSITIVE 5 [Humulus lupulus]